MRRIARRLPAHFTGHNIYRQDMPAVVLLPFFKQSIDVDGPRLKRCQSVLLHPRLGPRPESHIHLLWSRLSVKKQQRRPHPRRYIPGMPSGIVRFVLIFIQHLYNRQRRPAARNQLGEYVSRLSLGAHQQAVS
jgi:hypothetical protein